MIQDELGQIREDLYQRPGFLIRRAHQIAVALFLEETAPSRLTATQFGALMVLRTCQGLDQISLAKLVGIDRSTVALVVAKLEQDGYVERLIDPRDRRRRVLVLTGEGRRALEGIDEPSRRAAARALGVFSEADAATFVRLLAKFVDAFNQETRVPIAQSRPLPPRLRRHVTRTRSDTVS